MKVLGTPSSYIQAFFGAESAREASEFNTGTGPFYILTPSGNDTAWEEIVGAEDKHCSPSDACHTSQGKGNEIC